MDNKVKWWVLGIASLLVIVFFLWTNRTLNEKHSDKIVIGLNLPLTGEMSYYGNEVKRSFKILEEAASEFNVQFKFQDNQSLAKNSVSVMKLFMQNENIPIVVSCNSPLSTPLREIAEQNERIQLALVTGAKNFGKGYKWVFRDAINQTQEGQISARYASNNLRLAKGSIFVVNDDYGMGGGDSFKTEFTNLGGEILIYDKYNREVKDFKNDLTKILTLNPEFIYFVGREASIVTFINQLRDYNKNIPVITSDSFESPTVLSGIGENAIGIVFASYFNDFKSESYSNFVKSYEKNYKISPGIYAVDAYEACKYLLKIIKLTGNNPVAIREKLNSLEIVGELKGKLYVNEQNDIISQVSMYKIDSVYKKTILE